MTDTTAPDLSDVIWLPLHKKGNHYVCTISAKELEEKQIRQEIRKMLGNW